MIESLDRFDFIRYPDRILNEGMRSHIALTVEATQSAPFFASGGPAYDPVLEPIDELVKTLYEKASVNPTGVLKPDARAYLEREPRVKLSL